MAGNELPEVAGHTITVGLPDSAPIGFGADGKSRQGVSRAAVWASVRPGGVPATAVWGICKNKIAIRKELKDFFSLSDS